MSLYVNDEADSQPSPIRVYGNVKSLLTPTDCRTCLYGGMASCLLQSEACVQGSEYKASPPVQFWKRT